MSVLERVAAALLASKDDTVERAALRRQLPAGEVPRCTLARWASKQQRGGGGHSGRNNVSDALAKALKVLERFGAIQRYPDHVQILDRSILDLVVRGETVP
jgi:hypothetical protein